MHALVVYKARENNKHKGVSEDKCLFEKLKEIPNSRSNFNWKKRLYLMLRSFHYESHWFCLLRVYILATTANK